MSCWVVPALAADFWKIPLATVMERIQRGELVTRQEFGFTLLDIAPHSPRLGPGGKLQHFKPPTYREIDPVPSAPELTAPEMEEPLPPSDNDDEQEYEPGVLKWHQRRAQVAFTRRPPSRRAAA